MHMKKQVITWLSLFIPLGIIIAVLIYGNYFLGEAETIPTVKPKSPENVGIDTVTLPEYPIPKPPPKTPAVQLPELDESDDALRNALSTVLPDIKLYLSNEDIVRNIVVTVDNLSRDVIAIEKRAIKPVRGTFFVTEKDEVTLLSAKNFLRYTNMIRSLESVDLATLTETYFDHYALFQEAYEELGYPDSYFNDRVIEIIDHMLLPIDAPQDVTLVRPKGLYKFAKEDLEQLSAGQKVLLRVGPDHASVIRNRLKDLRKQLVVHDKPT